MIGIRKNIWFVFCFCLRAWAAILKFLGLLGIVSRLFLQWQLPFLRHMVCYLRFFCAHQFIEEFKMNKFVFVMRHSLVAIAMCMFGSASVHASIVVVDNGTTLTTTYDETFVLTSNVTTGGLNLHGIIFHNMFADVFTGGNPNNGIFNFRAAVNGGSEISLSRWGGWNYRVGEDSPGAGWSPENGLGLLWDANLLGGAVVGDSVRLFGSMTHDKGGFHHLPDFAPTTVEFSSYNGDVFATQDVNQQHVPVPEPATLALIGLGLAGIAFSTKKKTDR